MRGPFTLPTPSALAAEQRKRAGIARVKAWAESHVPKEKLKAITASWTRRRLRAQTRTARRSIRWFDCLKGTSGASLDSAEGGGDEEILDENMPPEEYIEGWIQGRDDLEWPPRHDPVLVEGEDPPKDVELRFGVKREWNVASKGEDGWVAGTITELWYRHPTWGPRDYAPYQIQLDDYDGKIFAPQDSDVCIRLFAAGKRRRDGREVRAGRYKAMRHARTSHHVSLVTVTHARTFRQRERRENERKRRKNHHHPHHRLCYEENDDFCLLLYSYFFDRTSSISCTSHFCIRKDIPHKKSALED